MRALILLFLALSPLAHAKTADEIVAEARDANRVESSIETVKMVIVSKSGSERVRELEMKAKRDGDVRKSYVRFTSPSDVAGTAMLLIDTPDKEDVTHFYMPAVKRTQQISGKQRQGSFMQSDFSFEDFELAGRAGTHTLVEETADTWVVETVPTGESAYGKVKATISKADYVSRKIEFYDDAGALLKVLEVVKTEKDGAVTIPVESVMKNVQKGTQTKMTIVTHKLGVTEAELPDETFTAAYLER